MTRADKFDLVWIGVFLGFALGLIVGLILVYGGSHI